MRVPIEDFEGQEVERVYFTASVQEAERIEAILDPSPFVYTIEPENTFGFLGRGVGIAFLVSPGTARGCKEFLAENGFTAGLEGSDEEADG